MRDREAILHQSQHCLPEIWEEIEEGPLASSLLELCRKTGERVVNLLSILFGRKLIILGQVNCHASYRLT